MPRRQPTRPTTTSPTVDTKKRERRRAETAKPEGRERIPSGTILKDRDGKRRTVDDTELVTLALAECALTMLMLPNVLRALEPDERSLERALTRAVDNAADREWIRQELRMGDAGDAPGSQPLTTSGPQRNRKA